MDSDKEDDVSKRFLPNLTMNVLAFALNFTVGILLVPYFITELGGYHAYGIVTISTSITSYVLLASDSISSSISRYMTMYTRKGSKEETLKTYNTSVFGILRIIMILIPLAILVALASPFLFDAGTQTSVDVQILFICVMASVLVTSFGSGFMSVLFANNRLDLKKTVKIVHILAQVSLIILFFNIWPPSLPSIGFAYLISAVVSVVLSYMLSRRTAPYLNMDPSGFDMERFREIYRMSVWSLVSALGILLLLETSKIIVNLMLGTEQAGYYGVITSIVGMLIVMVSMLGVVFTPITYRSYADGRISDMVRTCKSAVKMIGILLAMPVAFICVFSDQLLLAWLPGDVTFLSKELWIILFLFIFVISVQPLYPISKAYVKVKIPALVTLVLGAVNVILAVIFIGVFNMNISGAALAWVISMVMKNGIFIVWYNAKISGTSYFNFMRPLLCGFGLYLLSLLMCFAVNAVLDVPAAFVPLMAVAFVLFIVFIASVPRFILSKEEKNLIRRCLPKSLEPVLSKIFL